MVRIFENSFALHSIIPLITLHCMTTTRAFRLSLSASSSTLQTTTPFIITSNWAYESGDPAGARIRLVIPGTAPLQVLSTFSAFVDSGAIGFTIPRTGLYQVQAVDSDNNVLASSDTLEVISLASVSTQPGSLKPATTPTKSDASSTPSPLVTAPAMGFMASLTPTTSSPYSTSHADTSTPPAKIKTSLGIILGIVFPMMILLILIFFLCYWRHPSRHRRPFKFSIPTTIPSKHDFSRSASTRRLTAEKSSYDAAEAGARPKSTPTISGLSPTTPITPLTAPAPTTNLNELPDVHHRRSDTDFLDLSSPIQSPNLEPSFGTPSKSFPGSPRDGFILLPPTPLYLGHERGKRTPDVPVDLDEEGNSLRISKWRGRTLSFFQQRNSGFSQRDSGYQTSSIDRGSRL